MLPTLCVLLCLGGPATQDASPAPAPLDPAAAHVVAAQEAYAGGRLGDAHDHLRAALELAPGEPGVRLWTGRVLNDLGHGAEALEVLAPALADAPRSAWLLVERARAERGLQRFDDAEADLRAALDAYPTLDAARLELVDVLCERGAARAADALVELAPLRARRSGRPALVLREARALTLLARDDEAEALLRAAGAEPTVRLALCRHLAERHRPLDAWEVGAPLVEELADVEARTLLAQVARRAGEPLVALRLLGAVLLEDPTHATALAELGEVLEEAPRVLAEVTARRLAARPDDPDAWLELLEGCAREARFEDLLARCTELPAALRDDARVALLRGQALRRLGRADEARALLAPLAERGGARASYELGLLDYAAEDFEGAAAAFARGAAEAWAADAHFNRGVCLDRLGRYAAAADAYRAAVAARADLAEAWLQLGHDLRLRLARPAEARAAYREYLTLGGDDAEVRRFVESAP